MKLFQTAIKRNKDEDTHHHFKFVYFLCRTKDGDFMQPRKCKMEEN